MNEKDYKKEVRDVENTLAKSRQEQASPKVATNNFFSEPAPHLPYKNLNPTLVEYIECVARMTQSPIDFVVSTIFAFASGAIGSRIMLKDPKGYLNPPALWVCLLAPTGIGKTPVLTEISKPFEAMEKDFEKNTKKCGKNGSATERTKMKFL